MLSNRPLIPLSLLRPFDLHRSAMLPVPPTNSAALGFPFGFWPLYMGTHYYGDDEVSLNEQALALYRRRDKPSSPPSL